MFYNNIKSSFRHLLKNKTFTLINIIGLAIGMACSFLIFLHVTTELSYDKHFKNSEQIYRLAVKSTMGENQFEAAVTGGPLASTLKTELPEVEAYTRMREGRMTLLSAAEKSFYEENILYADSNFFEIFDYDLVQGDPSSVLVKPYSIILSEELARKFFGNEDPVGQQVKWNNQMNYTITAVFKKNEQKSHLNFDLLVSFSSLYQNERFRNLLQSYFAYTTLNYIKVIHGTDPELLEDKIAGLVDKYMGEGLAEYDGKYDVFLQPLQKIYLHSDLLHEMKTTGNVSLVFIFSAIAVLILIIAAINFVNLSTSRSVNRSVEVGLRKVFGADKGLLFKQFMGESTLTVFISLILSLIIFDFTLPLFNRLSGNEFILSDILSWRSVGIIFIGALLVGVAAGTYPALYMSRFKPIGALKQGIFGGYKKSWFRNVLVVIQFVISVFLIAGTFLIYKQLNYIEKKDMGIDQKDIVVVSLRSRNIINSYNTLKAEMSNIPGVYNVTGSSAYLGNLQQRRGFFPEGKGLNDMVLTLYMQIDQNYNDFFKTKIIQGRNFFDNSIVDSNAILINETYTKLLGWEEPVGKKIFIPGETEESSDPLRIVGVVKDFNYASFHQEIKPLILMNDGNGIRYLSLKINPENKKETLQLISSKWEDLYPGFPFEYFFQQSVYDEMYSNEVNMGKLFIYFSVLALFIAILGLLGLSSYTAEQRTKEIGIRRVLGSSISQVLILITKDFSKWILLAIIIAIPLTYYAMQKWLNNFAFHTDISWVIFLISGVIAFVIAYSTIFVQAWRASRSNPVDTLKYE